MSRVIVSLYDKRAACYDENLLVFNHKAEAVRAIQSAARKENSRLNQYPEDFTLVLLGTYEPSSGKIEVRKNPENIVDVSSLMINPFAKDSK
jgi:hypothetical protein